MDSARPVVSIGRKTGERVMAKRSRAEELDEILRGLVTETPEIVGAACISDDGLIISSVLPSNTDEDRIGGMASVLLSLGTRSANELNLKHLEQVLIKGEGGYALLTAATDGALLLVLTTRNAKLGMIFLDVKRAAAQIAQII
jgi:predicted regulator of Ras-like GTPase activity (Roadblock/LC7/MglB family)